jgi:hypothetical protein
MIHCDDCNEDPRDYVNEEPRFRNRFRCVDRLCGATDCSNCHPEILMQPENEEEE